MSDTKSERPDGQTAALAEGEAALWLSESLIFALIEAKVLDVDSILEAIEIVIAAKQAEKAEGGGHSPAIARAAVAQLAAISSSIGAATRVSPPLTARKPRRRPTRPD
ncbi:MAG TPA: hypothetical protein VHU15_05480 [Stellaceae bacterium]|jgi:hypothetical protein|nr:hypothetical protein [Stellaceae bacterium]